MSNEGRWVDELMPDEPMWVRDLVEEELSRRDKHILALQEVLTKAYCGHCYNYGEVEDGVDCVWCAERDKVIRGEV